MGVGISVGSDDPMKGYWSYMGMGRIAGYFAVDCLWDCSMKSVSLKSLCWLDAWMLIEGDLYIGLNLMEKE